MPVCAHRPRYTRRISQAHEHSNARLATAASDIGGSLLPHGGRGSVRCGRARGARRRRDHRRAADGQPTCHRRAAANETAVRGAAHGGRRQTSAAASPRRVFGAIARRRGRSTAQRSLRNWPPDRRRCPAARGSQRLHAAFTTARSSRHCTRDTACQSSGSWTCRRGRCTRTTRRRTEGTRARRRCLSGPCPSRPRAPRSISRRS